MKQSFLRFWDSLSKAQRIIFAVFSFLAVAILMSLGLIIALSISDGNISIKNATVTNVTESAFTVVWASDQPYGGSVVYQEGTNSWPITLAQLGKNIARDDRDIELTLEGEYKVKDGGTKSRYTHHVTVRGLKPETEYSFRVGGQINGKDTDIRAIKTAALNETISTPDPAYGKVQAADPDDVVLIFTVVKPQNNQDPGVFSSTSNPQGGYTVDAKSFNLSNFKATDIGVTVYNQNADPIDLGFNLETYKPLETLNLVQSNPKSGSSLPGLVKNVSAQVLRGTQCETQGANAVVCKENGSNLPSANCTNGGRPADGKVDCKCSNGKVVLDVGVAAGVANISSSNCTIPTTTVPTDTPESPNTGMPPATTPIQTVVGDPNVACGYYSCGNQIVNGTQTSGFCGSTALCRSKAALCGGYETYRNACGVTPLTRDPQAAPVLDATGTVIPDISDESATFTDGTYVVPANIRALQRIVAANGYNLERRIDAPNSNIERVVINPSAGYSPFTNYALDTWLYGASTNSIGEALTLINQIENRAHIQQTLYYRLFIGETRVILPTRVEVSNVSNYGTNLEHINFQLYAVCEPGYIFVGENPSGCSPDGSQGGSSGANSPGEISGSDAAFIAHVVDNGYVTQESVDRLSQIIAQVEAQDLIDDLTAIVSSKRQGVSDPLAYLRSLTVNVEVAIDPDPNDLTDASASVEFEVQEFMGRTSTERFTQLNGLFSKYRVEHCNSRSSTGTLVQAALITDVDNPNLSEVTNFFEELIENTGSIQCHSDNSNIGLSGVFLYRQTTEETNIPTSLLTLKTHAPVALLNGNLTTPSLAQTDNNAFAVNESGRYAFFRDGQRIADKDIQVTDGKVIIRLFNDTNGNGVRDENEEYVSDYSQITLSREASTVRFDLSSGWNLINIPMVDNRSENTVVKASDLIDHWIKQGAYITSVAKYEGDRFVMVVKRESGQLYDLDFDIIPGQALFVFNRGNPARVTFSGNTFPEGVKLRLNNSWNMVGIMPGDNVQSYNSEVLLDKLAQQSFQADTVSQFTNGSYQSVVKDSGTLFGNNFNIIPTRGYFVRVTSGGGDKEFTP